MENSKYRLVTRSDFDGLVCGMLLRELDLIDRIQFVHPKDMQDGVVPITGQDIVTNLPYVPGCHLVFDHHASEVARVGSTACDNHVIDPAASSAARVVYDYFGGPSAFPRVRPDLMSAVDQADSARFSRDDMLNPRGWVLLNFLMDPRTGLGRFHNFRVSNHQLMMQLIEHCRDHSIEQILALPDVQERVALYNEQHELFLSQLQRCTTLHGSIAVVDLREEEVIYAGNRFMVYALFPECEVSMHIIWGLRKEKTVFAIGKSILNCGCFVDVGALCLRHGGGGHQAAGTCQVPNDRAEATRMALIEGLSLDPFFQAA